MKTGKHIILALLALSILAASAWADTDINRGSVGISQATADDTYATLAGEDQYTKAHDFSVAELIAAAATKAGHVVIRSFGDGRYPQLGAASNTYTGVYLGPDGTNEAPTWSFAGEAKTGWYLSKAARMGATVGGVLVCTLDATTLDHDGSLDIGVDGTFGGNLDVTGNGVFDGNMTFGDVIGDSVTSNAGTWTYATDYAATFALDALFDASGGLARWTTPQFEIVGALEVAGNAQIVNGRWLGDKGADVASATELALGTDGNYFDVTGTTTIDHITKTGWAAGSFVVLQFDGSVTVTHNAGSPAGTEVSILLAGAGDFSATANDTLHLVYDGTTWREIGRAVI